METRDRWKQIASDLDHGLRQDLSAVRTRGGATGGQRGVVRARGAAGGSAPGVSEPLQQSVIVVVETPRGKQRADERQIRDKLRAHSVSELGPLDLYYIVRDKHWAVLEPRELNPDGEEHSADHSLLLRSLKADFAVLAAGTSRPAWCGEETRMLEW